MVSHWHGDGGLVRVGFYDLGSAVALCEILGKCWPPEALFQLLVIRPNGGAIVRGGRWPWI